MLKTDSFLTDIQQKLKGKLPGDDAHNKVVSYNRITPQQAIKTGRNPKQSAVLILLYKADNTWSFVLTRRKEYQGVHSKQISLPGGKIEEKDSNLQQTALRETQEEIGVNSQSIQILGKLTSLYIPPSNFIVQPFVGFIDYKPTFVLEEKEVAEIITIPVPRIWDDDVIKKTNVIVGDNMKIRVPYFDLKGHVVWGATAMVLSEFQSLTIKSRTDKNRKYLLKSTQLLEEDVV